MGRLLQYLIVLFSLASFLPQDHVSFASLKNPRTGTILDAGPLVPESTHVSFGNAELGYYTQQSLWIWNGGSETISIHGVYSNSSAFEVISVDSSIQPGDSTSLLLRFRPFIIGNHTGSIEIVSNASTSPDFITLSGTGVEPTVPASIADHVVISEVAPMMGNSSTYDTGEFIELYNPLPTDFTFDSDWSIISGDTAGTNPAEWQLPLDGGTIRGYGYYLIGDSGVPHRDATFPPRKNLTNSGLRSVVQLRKDTTVVDAFGWDTRSVNLNAEGIRFKPSDASSDGKSFERKSRDSTSTPNDLGNGWDTDENSVDFFENDSIEANPQSSTSPIESPYISLDDRPRISLYSGNNQTDTTGSSLTEPLQVLVTGDESQPLKGVPISFTIITTPTGAGGQALSDTVALTDKDGIAGTVFTLGNRIGTYEIEATAPGLIGNPVVFTATARGIALLGLLPDTLDFGSTLVGTVSDTSLVIRNAGTDTLFVSSLHSTSPQRFIVRTIPSGIAPGDSGISLLRFSAVNLGSVAGKFVIQSNTPLSPDTIIAIGKGVGIPIMAVDTSLIDFGSVRVGELSSDLVSISNFGNDTLKIFAASLKESEFHIHEGGRFVPPGQSVVDTVLFSPGLFGDFADTLVLVTANRTARIPLRGSSPEPEIVVTPLSLNFTGTPVASTHLKTVLITNGSMNTLVIDSIRVRSGQFATDRLSGSVADDTLRVQISFSPEAPGSYVDTVRFWNNSLTSPAVLPLTGIAPEPGLALHETDIFFPETAVGDSSIVLLMLYNESVSPLTLSNLSNDETQFTATAGAVGIAGLDSMQVELTYKPTAFGNIIDTLTVVSDGGDVILVLHGSSPHPVLDLSSSFVDFGDGVVDHERVLDIWIRNTSINELVIDSLRTSTTIFTVTPDRGNVGGNDSLSFSLGFIPDAFGAFADTIEIWSNAPGSASTVVLTGNSPEPTINTTVDAIHFGEVLLDSARVGFTNTSLNVLRIDSIYTRLKVFSLSRMTFPATVSRDETLSVWIHFAPDTIREYHDTLFVVANADPDQGGVSLYLPLSGSGSPLTSVPNQGAQLPTEFSLIQNYPNPFNATTTIGFSLPRQSRVRLEIYNLLGQLVTTLVNEERPAGYHYVRWHATVPTGLYLYRLETTSPGEANDKYIEVRKMTLLK